MVTAVRISLEAYGELLCEIFFSFFTVSYNVGRVRIATDQYAFQHYSPVLFYWNFSQ